MSRATASCAREPPGCAFVESSRRRFPLQRYILVRDIGVRNWNRADDRANTRGRQHTEGDSGNPHRHPCSLFEIRPNFYSFRYVWPRASLRRAPQHSMGHGGYPCRLKRRHSMVLNGSRVGTAAHTSPATVFNPLHIPGQCHFRWCGNAMHSSIAGRPPARRPNRGSKQPLFSFSREF